MAALELAHAYMRDVHGNIAAADDPARQAQFLNDLSLAAKQIAIAERADRTVAITVEDNDGGSLTFSLTHLKALSLFYEGVCRAVQDPRRAVRILEQSAALEPNAGETHYWIGLVNAELFNKQRAVAALQKAVAIDPKNLEYRKALGRAQNISGSQIAFDRAATGVRVTGKAIKIGIALFVLALLGSCVAALSDPATRGPILLMMFMALFAIGMLVSFAQMLWNAITGRG